MSDPSDPAPQPLQYLPLVRVSGMMHRLSEEIDVSDFDAAAATRLGVIQRQVLDDLDRLLPDALSDEIRRLTPIDPVSSPRSVSLVQAQVTGWLSGLVKSLPPMTSSTAPVDDINAPTDESRSTEIDLEPTFGYL